MVDEVTPQSDFYNNYGTWYKGIRKANLVLESINECEDITTSDLRDFMGRCYFLRAYFYYKLVEAYGPVPIVPETTYDVDASAESMSLERDTYEKLHQLYLREFRESIRISSFQPYVYPSQSAYFGSGIGIDGKSKTDRSKSLVQRK